MVKPVPASGGCGMEISRREFYFSDKEVAGKDKGFFRAGMDMGRVARARVELAENDGVIFFIVHREEL